MTTPETDTENTSNTIFCQKLKKQEEQLDFPPFPGEKGENIYNNISKKAWNMWLDHQTMLINEYRLNLLEKESKDFLLKEMEKFLFSDEETAKPEGYTPKK